MNTPQLTQEQVAKRAYEIYLANGCREGHDVDDWLQAEYELLAKPVRVLATMKAPKASNGPKASKAAARNRAMANSCVSLIALVQALV